jgi:hypothetical protein
MSEQAGVAQRLRQFVAEHGGSGTAVISYLGRRGARIVVVSADGPFTDAVVDDIETATAVCAAAGLPVGEWDREMTGRISVSSADRTRMAGTGR